jgi:hypothetical protein
MTRPDLIARTQDVMFELALTVDGWARSYSPADDVEAAACLLTAFTVLRDRLERFAPDAARDLALSLERDLVERIGGAETYEPDLDSDILPHASLSQGRRPKNGNFGR